jgi:succinate dehydrogenase/fumarate reductase flavoprotein subunit
VRRTLHDLASGADGDEVGLDAPLAVRPLREPPFHAVEVQPTVTFPYGGVRTDADGRVRDRDGAVVAGLFAAGADAGGLQGPGYVGGLVLGLVLGRRAAEAVHASIRPAPAGV